MILISKTYEIITHESAEHGDAEERGFLSENESVTFRELVNMLKDGEPSNSCASGSVNEWVTHYNVNECSRRHLETGETENHSIHFSRKNPERLAKYWRKAFKSAGF